MQLRTLLDRLSGTPSPRIVEWCGLIAAALAEVVIVTIMGVLPFLLAVVRYNFDKNEPSPQFDIATVFTQSFSGGQLYLYAFSLLGTLMWLGMFDWTVPYRAPRLFLALVAVLIGFLLAGLGGIDPTFSTIKNPIMVDWSFYFYGASIAIYFLLLVTTKLKPPSLRGTLRGETKELIDKYHGLQGQGP